MAVKYPNQPKKYPDPYNINTPPAPNAPVAPNTDYAPPQLPPSNPVQTVPKTPNAVPEVIANPDGSTTLKQPDGTTATYSKEQWAARLDAQMGNTGSSYKPNPQQAAADAIQAQISQQAQQMIADGKQVDYQQIFQNMSNDTAFHNFLMQLPQLTANEAAKPIEPYQPNPSNIKQDLAFGATGAGAAVGGAALLTAATGGAALPVTAPVIAGAAVSFVGGILAGEGFQRSENIAGATKQIDDAITNSRQLVQLAGTGKVDRLSILEAFYAESRRVRAAEAYLKEVQSSPASSFNKVAVTAERIKVQDYIQIKEPIYARKLNEILSSPDPSNVDLSFLNDYVQAGQ